MTNRVASRYTITIPLRGGRALAYNALSAALAVWEADEKNAYEQIRGGAPAGAPGEAVIQQLEHGGFVVREDTDELSVLQGMYNGHRYRQDAMTLTVAPTLACNFGCDYCFQGRNKPVEAMPAAVQDAVVDLVRVAAPNIKALGIAWYGGEPLLRRNVIESLSDRVMAICNERRIRYEASIVTNGYLLDAEAARSLVSRRVRVAQVTLDGVPEYHDARRHLLSKKGTFERIAENLREVVDAAPGLTLSIRVNIDDRNGAEIHRLLDHLAALGLGGRKNFRVYFAPIEAMTEGCHEVQEMTLSKSRYGKLEAELHRHGYRLGLTSLPYPPRFHGTCAAVRPKGFVIVPSGDVHKCWDTVSWPDRRVGTVFDVPALVRSDAALRWLRWTPFANDTCRNCKILPNCAGACAYKFVHASSTRGEAAVLPCPSWKYNIKERLLHRAVIMGAITTDDYDPEEARTISSELCAEVPVDGGEARTGESFFGEQRRRLPVLAASAAS